MESNPFSAPEDGPPEVEAAGVVDVVAALQFGTLAVIGQIGSVLGAVFVGLCIYVLSVCTCVGWIGTIPVLLYGSVLFFLAVIDGDAEVSQIYAGFERFGELFLSGWLLILLFFVLTLPLVGVQIGVTLAKPEGLISPLAGYALSLGVGLVWSVVIAPFTMASWLWVDRGISPLDAVPESFRLFRASWVSLAALQVFTQLLGLPAQYLGYAAETMQGDSSQLGLLVALSAAIYPYSIAYGVCSFAWFAHAYRQVCPKLEELAE